MRTSVLAVLLFGVFSVGPSWSSVSKNRLPASVQAAMAKPSRVELLSLEPGRPPGTPIRSFHGWKVLGSTHVLDPEKQRSLLSAVERGVSESDGGVAACFEPRHGVIVTAGKTTVDLVICFECSKLQSYVNGKEVEWALTGDSPQILLDKLLGEAGVPLGPRSER